MTTSETSYIPQYLPKEALDEIFGASRPTSYTRQYLPKKALDEIFGASRNRY